MQKQVAKKESKETPPTVAPQIKVNVPEPVATKEEVKQPVKQEAPVEVGPFDGLNMYSVNGLLSMGYT